MLPGFVDPHVHLRTPGREDEEDLESGTRAAAAGGFCCVLAMPNTDPVVDAAPVLRSLQERALLEAGVPVGFLAAITKGQRGDELTEMAELAGEGAAGFSDDGMPVADAQRLRQALQYQRLAAACSRCTRRTPRCRATARCTRGRSRRCSGWRDPLHLREHDDRARRRDRALRGQGRIHMLHLSAAESVVAVERARPRASRSLPR